MGASSGRPSSRYAPATSFSVPRSARFSPECGLGRPFLVQCGHFLVSVNTSLSLNRAGRCKGTWYTLVQMPWRSGSPHEVFYSPRSRV